MSDLIETWRNDFKGFVNSLNLSRDDYRAMMEYIDELSAVQPDHNANIGKKAEGDCISRQWLMECVSEGWIKFDIEKDENRFTHLVRDIAPSVQPEPKWIPVSERLPKDDKEVLLCINNGELWLGWHNITWKTEEFCFDKEQVIAWMPLPEPYKGGDSE